MAILNHDGRIAFFVDKILNSKGKTLRLFSNDRRSVLGHAYETSTSDFSANTVYFNFVIILRINVYIRS